MFKVEVDGVEFTSDGMDHVSSILFMLFNGKFTGGGCVVDPFACMNDGLIDLTWLHDQTKQGILGIADLLDKSKLKGASQIYDRTSTYVRGRKIKLTSAGKKGIKQPKNNDWGDQRVTIDGEDLKFKK